LLVSAFLEVSADIFEVVSFDIILLVVSGAIVVVSGLTVVVESLVLLDSPLLLQAANDAAMIAIAKNFFILGICDC
jgi:hypothetical protein